MGRWFEICAAGLAGVAAIFWFLSAAGKVPPMVTYWNMTPDTDEFYQAVKFSASMNTRAAIFSGLSAAVLAVKLFLFPT